MAALTFVSFFALGVLAVCTWRLLHRPKARARSVAVLVLGDIARSPRMMYHALSFERHHFTTAIVGYYDSRLPTQMLETNIQPVFLQRFPASLSKLPFLLLAPLKVLWQFASLFYVLAFNLPFTPEFIVLQNPPSIPTLPVAQLIAWLYGIKLIVDWHNLGYTMLALRLGPTHPLVKVAAMVERAFGRHAYAHLFVTKAMKLYLSRWSLRGHQVVLYDRPPSQFKRLAPAEAHDLFCSLDPELSSIDDFLPKRDLPRATAMTCIKDRPRTPDHLGGIRELRQDRPALLVSSTSWTEDEDFGMLLRSLSSYERKARDSDRLPRLLVIITGKGPLRDRYMNQVVQTSEHERWRYVRCLSLWLAAEDYPRLLGCADIGVSLHSSSSALDLPMKVVDLLGCGTPVLALRFACINELVKEGVNGLIFNDADELSDQIERILDGFPQAAGLKQLQEQLHRQSSGDLITQGYRQWGDWDSNWDSTLLPLVLRDFELKKPDFLDEIASSREHS